MMTFITAAQDTGERISLVLTALVSMFFFLKLVSERTPASDTIPLLSVYFVVLSFEVRNCYDVFVIKVQVYAWAASPGGGIGLSEGTTPVNSLLKWHAEILVYSFIE